MDDKMTATIDRDEINSYAASLSEKIHDSYTIDPKYYRGDAVKRGLRNADGSGVMAGVTRIGCVKGYYLNDSLKEPVKGELRYRGIEINEIIANYAAPGTSGYEEVAYLLLFGKLPTKDEFEKFNKILTAARRLPKGFFEDMILKAPSKNVMNTLERSVLAMYSYDHDPDNTAVENVVRQSIQLIGSLPTVVAHAYAVKRHIFGGGSLYIHNPDSFLHAEHGGGNNSTFVCRAVTSSGTDTYSAIAAAIGSLKGPLHGGANAKVKEMMDAISALAPSGSDEAVKNALLAILDGKAGDGKGKIYGLGHAIYTISDPRAEAIKRYARHLVQGNGLERDFALAEAVERIGIELIMEKTGRDLPMCANVDLYSGIVYRALGIPEDLFTPLFAIARIAGWCAHRLEELISGGRIIRPAYRSSMKEAHYIPMSERG